MATQDYLDLVTSEHASQPDFMASLIAVIQPVSDTTDAIASMPALFDLDVAIGDQLDKTGQWIGPTRYLTQALVGVYFALDTAGIGFDQGTWFGPFDPTTGLVRLPDDSYRKLLYATVAANQWNGSIPAAYAAYQILFGSEAVLIQDRDDMSFELYLVGGSPTAIEKSLFKNGELSLKPSGVRINGYYIDDAPVFGFDVSNANISGFDSGQWPLPL